MTITTGKVRASYVSIFRPSTPQGGGEPKYSVTLLIPKGDTTTLNSIYAEIERAKQEGAQKVFGGNIPPVCKTTLYDGDGVQESGAPFGEECRGCMVLRTSAKIKPSIVGLDMQEILNPADVYSGCYIRANINFYAYSNAMKRGIGCGLNAVQKIEDGEPLTARVSAEEAFGGSNAYNAVPAMPYPGAVPAGIQYPQMLPGGYQQPVSTAYPAQPAPAPMAFPQQPVPAPVSYPQQAGGQIDPITGRPMLTGGVMGLQ